MKKYISLCFCCLFVTACQNGHYQHYLNLYAIPEPKQESFIHCFNYGCQTRNDVALPENTSKKLQKLFKRPAKTAEAERERISKAIQIFETDIGAITGTKNDKYGTFRLYQDNAESTKSFQQDCIDESTNTTIYLALLEKMELLQFHAPSFPATRQPFVNGGSWWHQTATIIETETEEKYAVDSWFFDNGAPASIISLKEWKGGWRPPPEANKNKK